MIKYRIFHKILNKSPQLLKLIKYNKQQQYVKYKCIYKFNKEYSTLRKMNKYYNTIITIEPFEFTDLAAF